uniref:Uncharacterized protein n=1 Tax=Arundo donax TaxID=35708 RepID=A0A0A9D2U9_ARUDO
MKGLNTNPRNAGCNRLDAYTANHVISGTAHSSLNKVVAVTMSISSYAIA